MRTRARRRALRARSLPASGGATCGERSMETVPRHRWATHAYRLLLRFGHRSSILAAQVESGELSPAWRDFARRWLTNRCSRRAAWRERGRAGRQETPLATGRRNVRHRENGRHDLRRYTSLCSWRISMTRLSIRESFATICCRRSIRLVGSRPASLQPLAFLRITGRNSTRRCERST